MADYTEEVETVLPANFSVTKKKKKKVASHRDSDRSNEATVVSCPKNNGSKGGLLSRGRDRSSKMFSKIRQYARSRSRSVSRERFQVTKTKSKNKKQVTKKTTVPSMDDSNSTQKQSNTTDNKSKMKEERRDTEEASPTSTQPSRDESPAPTMECPLTDASAESQPKVESEPDGDESMIDTRTLYVKIASVEDCYENNQPVADNSALIRNCSGVSTSSKKSTNSVCSKKSASSKKGSGSKVAGKTEPPKQVINQQLNPVQQEETIYQAQEEVGKTEPPKQDAIEEVAQQDFDVTNSQVPAAGHTWAKNISLKFGDYETSFQMADPVAAITDKVKEVMGGFDSSKSEEQDDKENERDFETNPTKLFLLLQQKAWGLVMVQLEKHPEEAKIWMYRKFIPEKAPDVHDATDPVKSQALVIQSQALSTTLNKPPEYRWKLLPLHAAIVLGAPQEVTTRILNIYPEAARKVDERGSLPVHLAASRLDVDEEGEKVVLHLFSVYADSIDIEDRGGRTPPELAKLARARKAAQKQRLMETASRASRASRMSYTNVETSVEMNGREIEEDDDEMSVKSSFSTRFRNMLKGSKSMDVGERKSSKVRDSKSAETPEDIIVADAEGMAPGFAFLTAAKETEERETQEIAEEVRKEVSKAKKKPIAEEYKTSTMGLTAVPEDALNLPLPFSMSFADDNSLVKSKSQDGASAALTAAADANVMQVDPKVTSTSDESVTTTDDSSLVSTVVDSIAASTDKRASLRALLERAAENAGRPGMDVTKFLVILENEWVTDIEAIRRLDGRTLDDILPIMLSRELQRLVNHSHIVDAEYLRRTRGRGRSKTKYSESAAKKTKKKTKKKKSIRRKPASRRSLAPINEEDDNESSNASTPISEEEEEESKTTADKSEDESTPSESTPSDESTPSTVGTYDEGDEMRKKHAAIIHEARSRFPTREALEDAIHERQATVKFAVSSGFDVDKQTLAQAALADDEVRKLLPLRLVLPSVVDLKEMVEVLQNHKQFALKAFDVKKALRIENEIDEIKRQIDEEEKYIRRKQLSQTTCEKCGDNFDTEKKMVGILKKKQQICENCRVMSEV